MPAITLPRLSLASAARSAADEHVGRPMALACGASEGAKAESAPARAAPSAARLAGDRQRHRRSIAGAARGPRARNAIARLAARSGVAVTTAPIAPRICHMPVAKWAAVTATRTRSANRVSPLSWKARELALAAQA